MRNAFDWLFRNRQSGRIAIIQFPNVPLWIFVAGAAVRRFADPHGDVLAVLTVVTTSALVVWALLELFRGANPFRRMLGGGVLIVTLVGVARSAFAGVPG